MTEEIIKQGFDKAFKNNFPEAVIIDGVNVAGCEYIAIQDGYIGCTNNENGECEKCFCAFKKRYGETPQTIRLDDFYKSSVLILQEELQRLKQENERLRFPQKDLSYAVLSKEEFEVYQNLKQENEELKKEIQSQKGLITVGGKQQYEMTLAYDKFKTALEEIREIAMGIMDEDTEETSCYYDANTIINKINEVLGNECN